MHGAFGSNEERYLMLDDSSFFTGNSLDSVTKNLRVIELDGGDDGENGGDDVGGVQSSTETHF